LPALIVNVGETERRIPFAVGRSVRDILDTTALRVRAGCGGRGACGLCRVRIDRGKAGAPTANERICLDTSEIDQGVRLACQVTPMQDLRIVILATAPRSRWRSIPDEAGRHVRQLALSPWKDLPPEVIAPCGVAIDLGTTHISLSLYSMSSGKWLSGRYGPNPQMCYGSDVMTRLLVATASPEQARAMSRQVLEAIGEALLDVSAREGIDLERIVRLTLVGNTAMLALLSGQNYDLLLQPGHWTSPVPWLSDHPDLGEIPLGVHPRAQLEVIRPLAGFVGSDLLAGVMSTGLVEDAPGGLFIDIGTNSEIALWDGRVLWVTSAAGGPAFEESGVHCGAPADDGAISRVSLQNGMIEFDVISNSEPRGLCGSGLVDLIAALVRLGRLTRKGQFGPDVSGEGLVLKRGERPIVLTKRDVDLIQRAKAAVGTGVQVLLTQAAMTCKDLSRICVGGLFGRFLDVVNAQEIGLLPVVPVERVELCGNSALAGCAEALLSPVVVRRMEDLREQARIVSLSRWPGFDDLYLKNLYLQPMRGG
jgi:uncharacterized 2Fe-2S/4Fe-4S cluster protein (DUF4445 family)